MAKETVGLWEFFCADTEVAKIGFAGRDRVVGAVCAVSVLF